MELTYQTYSAVYPKGLTEEDFDSFLPSAVAFVNVLTHNRARDAEGWKQDRVAHAVFAVVNEMAAEQATRGQNGAKLSSVSNDGYTETYARGTAEDGNAIKSAAFRWLSGTGLMSAL